MNEKKINSGNTTKKKGGGIVPIVGICCAVVIVGAVVLLGGHEEKAPKRNVVVTKDNVEDVIQELEEKEPVSFGSYRVKMSSTDWIFPDGTSAAENAYVENNESNTNDVYFDIIRSDTNETIYKSPVLPLGSHLKAITLDTDLDAGTYDCVMVYHLIDENQETLSTLNLSLTITVEN